MRGQRASPVNRQSKLLLSFGTFMVLGDTKRGQRTHASAFLRRTSTLQPNVVVRFLPESVGRPSSNGKAELRDTVCCVCPSPGAGRAGPLGASRRSHRSVITGDGDRLSSWHVPGIRWLRRRMPLFDAVACAVTCKCRSRVITDAGVVMPACVRIRIGVMHRLSMLSDGPCTRACVVVVCFGCG